MKRSKSSEQTQTVRRKTPENRSEQSRKPALQIPKANYLHLLVIIILTGIVFYPSLQGEITNWDDNLYLTENPYIHSLSSENVKAIFSEKSYMGNYHPLTMLSLAADYQLAEKNAEGKPNPFIFHLVNLLLHIAVSILVYFIIMKILKNSTAALFAGLLFAVHTLHVESVSWLSERKDVLYAAFFMASLLSYLQYIAKKHWAWLLLSFLLFMLSLLSKGQAVSLAVTLVVLDIFYKRDLRSYKLWAEKIPYLAAALYFGILAIQAQQAGDALVVGEGYPFLQRISIAAYGFTMYILKLFVPVNLSAMYPYPDIINQTVPWYYTASILVVIGVIVLFWKSLRKYPIIALGIALFAVNIALLLQLIPVGSAVYADRYAYIPSLGFFIIAAWGIQKTMVSFSEIKNLIFAAAGIYIILLGVLTFERNKVWLNSESLWDDTIEKSPHAVVARNNRGSLKNTKAMHFKEENLPAEAVRLWKEAIEDFNAAVNVKPDYVHAFYNRGATKFELSKHLRDSVLMYEALADFNTALQFDPLFHDAYHYRANVYSELNQLGQALDDYKHALELAPDKPEYLINRGVNLGKMGRLEEAVNDLSRAVQLDPSNHSAFGNLGRAYAGLGEYESAISNYTKALELKPDFNTARYNRGIAFWKMKRYDASLADFTEALQINPRFSDALLMRGQVFLEMQRLNEACADFTQAAEMGNPAAAQLAAQLCGTP